MVPGANAPPTSGSKLCSVLLGVSSGTAFGTTAPAIWLVAAGKPGALAVTLIATCEEEFAGDQVPEYNPWPGLANGRARGGSPLVNVATTWPLVTTEPQSLASTISSGVGHPAGCEKLFTRPVCAGTSTVGVQLLAFGRAFGVAGANDKAEAVAALLEMIRVTFTVRTAVAESE